MDGLLAEIEKKRKLQQQAKEQLLANKRTKYVTRGELNDKLREISHTQKLAQAADQGQQAQPTSPTKDKTPTPSVEGGEAQHEDLSEEDRKIVDEMMKLSEQVIFRRLRAVRMPIKLFGEEPRQRVIRLHRAELEHPELVGTGEANTFGKLLRQGLQEVESEVAMPARRKVDAIPTDNNDEEGEKQMHRNTSNTSVDTEDHTTNVDDSEQQRKAKIHMMAMHLDNKQWSQEESIRYFFEHLLREWEQYLQQRKAKCLPTEKRKLAFIKKDFAILQQTKDFLKPLFTQLKQHTLDDLVETTLAEMMNLAKHREYIKAHDKYIGIAIGKAAWPIGVTMTGIHERSAREKIQQNQVAHILNDEKARKYLQAVKRCLTFCQIRYPTDPSKCFEYNATLFSEDA